MKLTEISTVGMSHEDWLMHRKNAIGGSVYELWANKLGRIPSRKV